MKISANDIKDALRQRYCQPEYELMFEVEGDQGRRADAIAMNMWPSRGNYITGFEIKVSRSDLQRELKQGVKAESTSKYCDYWVLVTPKGLIPDNVIIPPTWGIMEYLDNKTLKFKQKPPKKDNTKRSLWWFASMFRAAYNEHFHEINILKGNIRKDIEKENNKKIMLEVEGRTHSVTQEFLNFRAACEKIDLYLDSYDAEGLARKLKLATKYDTLLHGIFKLNVLKNSLRNNADEIELLQSETLIKKV